MSYAGRIERDAGALRVAGRSAGDCDLAALYAGSRDGLRAAGPSHAVVLSERRLSNRAAQAARTVRRTEPPLCAARRSRVALVGARSYALHASVFSARTLHASRRAGTRPGAARTDAGRSHLFRTRADCAALPVAGERDLGRSGRAPARQRDLARSAEPAAAGAIGASATCGAEGRPVSGDAAPVARLHRRESDRAAYTGLAG